MKAVVIHATRDLRVEEREAEAPGTGQLEIAVEAGGICGSDLHYFNHGGFGTVRVREPMILGHEVAGTVKALGASVSGLSIGDRVAVSPSRPCNACDFCLKGQQNQCLNMRFYGSAMPMPHIQGAFRQRLVRLQHGVHRLMHGALGEAAHPEQTLLQDVHIFFEVAFHPILFSQIHELRFLSPVNWLVGISQISRCTLWTRNAHYFPSSETPGDVSLGARITGRGEELRCRAELDELANQQKRGEVADACGLLHVVRYGHDGAEIL